MQWNRASSMQRDRGDRGVEGSNKGRRVLTPVGTREGWQQTASVWHTAGVVEHELDVGGHADGARILRCQSINESVHQSTWAGTWMVCGSCKATDGN